MPSLIGGAAARRPAARTQLRPRQRSAPAAKRSDVHAFEHASLTASLASNRAFRMPVALSKRDPGGQFNRFSDGRAMIRWRKCVAGVAARAARSAMTVAADTTRSRPPSRRPGSRPGWRSAAANGPARPSGIAPGYRAGQSRHPAGGARRPTSCGSASSTPSPARCSRSARRAIRGCRRSAEDLDIRTDVLRYRVFRNGELVDEPTDIAKHWRDDLVDLRARLLVLVRRRADRGRHRAAPHHLRLRPCRCIAPRSRPRRRVRSTGRWWCRCGR